MTVLMTADTVGGVWTYALDLARGLGARGTQVVLATMGEAPTPEQRQEAREIDTLTLVESTYRLEWMAEPWADVESAGTWLLDLDRRVRPDVVHLNGYAHGALPFSGPVLMTAHSCVLSWWAAVKGEDAPASWNRYRAAVLSGLSHADTVVAPSRAMADSVQRFYEPPSPVRVVPNGRDPAMYSVGAKANYVLTAGRLWDEAKNVATVAAAAASMPWPVYVAGDTAQDQGLETITSLGRLSTARLARWYAEASIYTLPAKYEPFGLSALEAGLSGCALVLGDIPSLREVWGAAALYVQPDDASGLAEAVSRLAADDAFRQEMAARALARARHYSLDAAVDAYLAIYDELIAARASAGGLQACAS